MAEDVRLIRLTYENGNRFKMDTKLNNESYITIIEMEENGKMKDLMLGAQSICQLFFNSTMTDISGVMTAD